MPDIGETIVKTLAFKLKELLTAGISDAGISKRVLYRATATSDSQKLCQTAAFYSTRLEAAGLLTAEAV